MALERLHERGYGFAVGDYHRAAVAGDVEAVRQFIEAGMAVDVEGPEGETAYQKAARGGWDDLVRFLVEAGAEPDQRLTDGRTMLMKVAGRAGDDLRMLEFLLDHGADAHAMDGDGMSSLMIATLAGNVDAVRRLARVDVRSLDKALMLGSAKGHTHCLEALIERGAYLNCRSHDSQTPLMYAAGRGHQEAARLLLRHRANRFALDDEGRTAADRAEAGGFAALAAVLRDASDLVSLDLRARDEFPPNLDGQSIAFLAERGETALPNSLEPERPVLDGLLDAGSEDRPGPAGGERRREVDLVQEIELGRFEERFEPILITEVREDAAVLRLLHRPPEQALVTVPVGERIPDTWFEVTAVTRRTRPAESGAARDESEVLARDTRRQTEHRFLPRTLPRDADTHLVVVAKRSGQDFAARIGDTFTVAETGRRYVVTDIRPHQLVIRGERTNEVLTIQRR